LIGLEKFCIREKLEEFLPRTSTNVHERKKNIY